MTACRYDRSPQRGRVSAGTQRLDHALRAAGITFVEAGYPATPARAAIYAWQVEGDHGPHRRALWPVLDPPARCSGGNGGNRPPARPPVIVDASAALPREEPKRSCRGADSSSTRAARRSAGRGERHPRGPAIRASVALQQLDLDVRLPTWTARSGGGGALRGIPHHGIGRGMKVGGGDRRLVVRAAPLRRRGRCRRSQRCSEAGGDAARWRVRGGRRPLRRRVGAAAGDRPRPEVVGSTPMRR